MTTTPPEPPAPTSGLTHPWTVLNMIMTTTSFLTLLSQVDAVTLYGGVRQWVAGFEAILDYLFSWTDIIDIEVLPVQRVLSFILIMLFAAMIRADPYALGNPYENGGKLGLVIMQLIFLPGFLRRVTPITSTIIAVSVACIGFLAYVSKIRSDRRSYFIGYVGAVLATTSVIIAFNKLILSGAQLW